MDNSKFINHSNENDFYRAKYIKYRNKCKNFRKKMDQMNGGRLRNSQIGGVGNREKLDEIHFWMHQFDEHLVIIVLGIEVDPDMIGGGIPKDPSPYVENAQDLKMKGVKLHVRAKNYFNEVFTSKGIEEEKIVLDDSDYAKLGNTDSMDKEMSDAMQLVDEILEYKREVLSNIQLAESSRKWLGWIQESLVQHMIDELDFFQKIVKSGSDINNDFTNPSIQEQISFWTKINAEHVGMASHLLDIDYANDADFRNAYDSYNRAQEFIGFNRTDPVDLSQQLEDYLKTLEDITNETKNKIDNGMLKSVIHPDLANHDLREAERAKAALKALADKQGYSLTVLTPSVPAILQNEELNQENFQKLFPNLFTQTKLEQNRSNVTDLKQYNDMQNQLDESNSLFNYMPNMPSKNSSQFSETSPF